MRRTILFVISFSVILSILFSFIRDVPLLEKETIKVGALVCLSGSCAEWGQNSLNGISLAVQEINSMGGIAGQKIELVVEDSREDKPHNAIAGYNSLVSVRSLQYIVGPTWTPAALALAPIAGRHSSVLTISPSVGVRDFNESADNLFNLWPHDDVATRKLAQFAIQKGWKSAGIFSSQQPWEKLQGDTFEAEFIRLGGLITAKFEPLVNGTGFKEEALKMVQVKPDLVFYSNFTDMGLAARMMKQYHWESTQLAILMDKTRIEIARGGLEGTIFSFYPEASSKFTSSYFKAYGAKPGNSADTAYDTVKLLAMAISNDGNELTPDIKARLLSIRDYKGASGEIVFDKDGGVLREPKLYRVRGENYEELSQ